jgi:uncharacterized protein (DUF1501 family)
MRCNYACGSDEHLMHRRKFLGTAAFGLGGVVAGLGAFGRPALAHALDAQNRRVLVINMHGGLSQLESWDPKPGTATGGPFRAIPTSVPGIHISELLPMTARQMHHLTIVRGVNTAEDDHAKGAYMMTTGRRKTPAANYPVVGAVMAKALAPEDSPLPGHVVITPGGGGGRSNDAAYLGPKFASVVLGNGQPPLYSSPPVNADAAALVERDVLRRHINDRFTQRRRTAQTDAFTFSYEQALQLMERRQIFDVTKESQKDIDRYGRHDLGRHCLLARRLLQNGVSFVQVTHSNYDTHNENFDFHLEQLGEFDRPFACLIEDLAASGMLEHTVVIVLSEFGRTPNINLYYGRDHWSKAWSVVVGGGRIPRGHVHGRTNENGTAVADGQVDHANLFHTYLQALGIDSSDNFMIDGRPTPMADPASAPIKELLT